MFTQEDLRERSHLDYICKSYMADEEYHLFLECVFQEEDVDLTDLYIPDSHYGYDYCMAIHRTLAEDFREYSVIPMRMDTSGPQYQALERLLSHTPEFKLLDPLCNGLLIGTLIMLFKVYREMLTDIEDFIQNIEECLFADEYDGPIDFQHRIHDCLRDIGAVFAHIDSHYGNDDDEGSLSWTLRGPDNEPVSLEFRPSITE